MNKEIKDILKEQKEFRNFDVKKYVDWKILLINKFFEKSNLDACVLGVSGGIDSAITLALLERCESIKKVRAVVAPINGNGTSKQDEAENRAMLIINSLKSDFVHFDLTSAYNSMLEENAHSYENESWVNGQMASVLRTPLFYYQAAILQAQNYKSIVVGTTNRDEGSYIGFFGKASDGMVDFQPISDIHKSEVYEVARYLNVPEEIINVDPKGDVHDGKIDTEMIGSSYEMLENYITLMDYCERKGFMFEKFYEENLNNFTTEELTMFSNIEKLHSVNKHKYMVGMPSHFLDVMKRKVLGGWS